MCTSDEMFIGATFTHPDKNVKYKVTAIATPFGTASDSPASGSAVAISLFHAKPALKKHGVDEIVVTKLQLVARRFRRHRGVEGVCEVQEDRVLRSL